MAHHHHSHNHAQAAGGAGNHSAAGLWLAFLLNLFFAVFELVGGLWTGSVAILSDALHDLGDAGGIGLSLALEKKSRRAADKTHTYGYARYSVLGGLIVTGILLVGSCGVVAGAVRRMLHPTEIHYEGMILFAVVGVAVNAVAALLTRDGESLHRRAVNLHMLEDVLGWAVVLAGAIVMHFTHWSLLDPLLSIGVALFILAHAVGNLREAIDLFLERVPRDVDVDDLRAHLTALEGVTAIHALRVRSLDGTQHEATLRAEIVGDSQAVKEAIRTEFREHGVAHAIIETEEHI